MIRNLNILEEKVQTVFCKIGVMHVLHITEIEGPANILLVQQALSLLQYAHPLLSASISQNSETGEYYFEKSNLTVPLKHDELNDETLSTEHILELYVPQESLIILPIENKNLLWRVIWVSIPSSSSNVQRNYFIFHLSHSICDGGSLSFATKEFLRYLQQLYSGKTVDQIRETIGILFRIIYIYIIYRY
jgi:hypothetical protein